MIKPLKVLLWTEEEDHEELLAYNLIREGFAVASVSDEKDIVPQNLAISPDVILMGDCSSDEKFIEITRQVKEDSEGKGPAIVCITTRSVIEKDDPVCMATDACLMLPAKPRDIIAKVVAVVAENKTEDCC